MALELELEELRQLQETVSRHEDHAFKIRGWMYAVIGALTASLFSENLSLDKETYLLVSLGTTVLFLCSELVHRAYVRLAIDRSSRVQWILREKKVPYDGPLISKALAAGLVPATMMREFSLASVWVHYSALWVMIILFGWTR